MRSIFASATLGVALVLLACGGADVLTATVYKSPTCGCCGKWIEHLEAAGLEVESVDVADMTVIKANHEVPERLASCHTALIGGYLIEGHVPVEDIERLLAERPDIVGLAVPGMPIGSPGMEGPNPETYDVLAFDATGATRSFATHQP
jgi:hypothetical protein